MNIQTLPGDLNPCEVIGFFDLVRFRLTRPLGSRQLDILGKNARSVHQHLGQPIRGSDKIYRLEIVAPNKEALRMIAMRRDAIVNYAEVALDLMVEDEVRLERLFDFIICHLARRWRGRSRIRRFADGESTDGTATHAIYFGRKSLGTTLVAYSDRESKRRKGEMCAHIEIRLHGTQTLRRHGLDNPSSLLAFDQRVFWTRNLSLFRIDFERLGRRHANRMEQAKRKSVRVDRFSSFAFNRDLRTGASLFRSLAVHEGEEFRSLQAFIDKFGRDPVWLKPIDAHALLPPAPAPLLLCKRIPHVNADAQSRTR